MSDLSFAEVDEAINQERITRLWHTYKHYLISFIVGVVLLTAIMSGYKHWDTTTRTAQTTQMMDLIESADFPNNITIEGTKMRASIKSMLFMRAANRHFENGNLDQAKAFYSAIAETGSTDHKSLALIALSRLSPDVDPTETLKPILKQNSNIWRSHALLEVALYQAQTSKDYQSAIATLNQIINAESLVPSVNEKAKALKHLYTIKLSQSAKEE
jgi:hypothetical protein